MKVLVSSIVLSLFATAAVYANTTIPFVKCTHDRAVVSEMFVNVGKDRIGKKILIGTVKYYDGTTDRYFSALPSNLNESVYNNEIHLKMNALGDAYPKTIEMDIVDTDASLAGKNLLINGGFDCRWVR
jgi:hypothetical protein